MKGAMPQEIEVWYVIPAIRAGIAENLLVLNMNQKRIADTLGLTEAAVSQYIKKKRATGITFDLKIKKEIKSSSEKILKDGKKTSSEIGRILKLLKKTDTLCRIHEKYGTAEKNCKMCR